MGAASSPGGHFALDIRGDLALFSRPEFSVDKISYPIPTPSALRGIIESVYWHPGMRYRIERIHVLNEIKYQSYMSNGISSRASASAMARAMAGATGLPSVDASSDRVQVSSMVLTDVSYRVEASFSLAAGYRGDPGVDAAAKHASILHRRLKRGASYRMPYLGKREYAAVVSEALGDPGPGFYAGSGTVDLGYVLYDMDYDNPGGIRPCYFHAVMVDGIVQVGGIEVLR